MRLPSFSQSHFRSLSKSKSSIFGINPGLATGVVSILATYALQQITGAHNNNARLGFERAGVFLMPPAPPPPTRTVTYMVPSKTTLGPGDLGIGARKGRISLVLVAGVIAAGAYVLNNGIGSGASAGKDTSGSSEGTGKDNGSGNSGNGYSDNGYNGYGDSDEDTESDLPNDNGSDDGKGDGSDGGSDDDSDSDYVDSEDSDEDSEEGSDIEEDSQLDGDYDSNSDFSDEEDGIADELTSDDDDDGDSDPPPPSSDVDDLPEPFDKLALGLNLNWLVNWFAALTIAHVFSSLFGWEPVSGLNALVQIAVARRRPSVKVMMVEDVEETLDLAAGNATDSVVTLASILALAPALRAIDAGNNEDSVEDVNTDMNLILEVLPEPEPMPESTPVIESAPVPETPTTTTTATPISFVIEEPKATESESFLRQVFMGLAGWAIVFKLVMGLYRIRRTPTANVPRSPLPDNEEDESDSELYMQTLPEDDGFDLLPEPEDNDLDVLPALPEDSDSDFLPPEDEELGVLPALPDGEDSDLLELQLLPEDDNEEADVEPVPTVMPVLMSEAEDTAEFALVTEFDDEEEEDTVAEMPEVEVEDGVEALVVDSEDALEEVEEDIAELGLVAEFDDEESEEDEGEVEDTVEVPVIEFDDEPEEEEEDGVEMPEVEVHDTVEPALVVEDEDEEGEGDGVEMPQAEVEDTVEPAPVLECNEEDEEEGAAEIPGAEVEVEATVELALVVDEEDDEEATLEMPEAEAEATVELAPVVEVDLEFKALLSEAAVESALATDPVQPKATLNPNVKSFVPTPKAAPVQPKPKLNPTAEPFTPIPKAVRRVVVQKPSVTYNTPPAPEAQRAFQTPTHHHHFTPETDFMPLLRVPLFVPIPVPQPGFYYAPPMGPQVTPCPVKHTRPKTVDEGEAGPSTRMSLEERAAKLKRDKEAQKRLDKIDKRIAKVTGNWLVDVTIRDQVPVSWEEEKERIARKREKRLVNITPVLCRALFRQLLGHLEVDGAEVEPGKPAARREAREAYEEGLGERKGRKAECYEEAKVYISCYEYNNYLPNMLSPEKKLSSAFNSVSSLLADIVHFMLSPLSEEQKTIFGHRGELETPSQNELDPNLTLRQSPSPDIGGARVEGQVLKESKFKEHGRITPEEFVAAGDFLVYKFPVWSWEKGDASKARDFLPTDKQYLLTRGVPCLRRATSLAYTDADEDAERLLSFGDSSAGGEADEWVETHAGRTTNADSAANPGTIDDIPDLDGDDHGLASGISGVSLGTAQEATPDLDDIPDMEEDDLEEKDEATASKPAAVVDTSKIEVAKGNLLQVRTYDVMITYDKYYQTPRVWLIGYDENGTPLTPPQIFQDISADHAHKTVTIEQFIHSASLQAASVHPCKHASVMKKVIERMNNSVVEEQLSRRKAGGSSSAGKESSKKKWPFTRKANGSGKDDKAPAGEEDEVEGMRVDFYLVVFLKFIASIVPTIEVDSTTAF
ncbi:hypothetical protein DXG01_006907 [Tephrocybe rancida]|nr:hypothetical protein DXG01_006907 [Tephrocybe rancida]